MTTIAENREDNSGGVAGGGDDPAAEESIRHQQSSQNFTRTVTATGAIRPSNSSVGGSTTTAGPGGAGGAESPLVPGRGGSASTSPATAGATCYMTIPEVANAIGLILQRLADLRQSVTVARGPPSSATQSPEQIAAVQAMIDKRAEVWNPVTLVDTVAILHPNFNWSEVFAYISDNVLVGWPNMQVEGWSFLLTLWQRARVHMEAANTGAEVAKCTVPKNEYAMFPLTVLPSKPSNSCLTSLVEFLLKHDNKYKSSLIKQVLLDSSPSRVCLEMAQNLFYNSPSYPMTFREFLAHRLSKTQEARAFVVELASFLQSKLAAVASLFLVASQGRDPYKSLDLHCLILDAKSGVTALAVFHEFASQAAVAFQQDPNKTPYNWLFQNPAILSLFEQLRGMALQVYRDEALKSALDKTSFQSILATAYSPTTIRQDDPRQQQQQQTMSPPNSNTSSILFNSQAAAPPTYTRQTQTQQHQQQQLLPSAAAAAAAPALINAIQQGAVAAAVVPRWRDDRENEITDKVIPTGSGGGAAGGGGTGGIRPGVYGPSGGGDYDPLINRANRPPPAALPPNSNPVAMLQAAVQNLRAAAAAAATNNTASTSGAQLLMALLNRQQQQKANGEAADIDRAALTSFIQELLVRQSVNQQQQQQQSSASSTPPAAGVEVTGSLGLSNAGGAAQAPVMAAPPQIENQDSSMEQQSRLRQQQQRLVQLLLQQKANSQRQANGGLVERQQQQPQLAAAGGLQIPPPLGASRGGLVVPAPSSQQQQQQAAAYWKGIMGNGDAGIGVDFSGNYGPSTTGPPMYDYHHQVNSGGTTNDHPILPLPTIATQMPTVLPTMAAITIQPAAGASGFDFPGPALPPPPPAQQQQQQQAGSASSSMGAFIDKQVETFYGCFYNGEVSADQLVSVFCRLRQKGGNSVENLLAWASLRTLTSEFAHFHQYPERELEMTAQLLAQLLRSVIVKQEPDLWVMILKVVLDGLKSKSLDDQEEPKLFKFGLEVLAESLDIIPQSPKFLASCLAIPRLITNYPNFVAYCRGCLAAIDPRFHNSMQIEINTTSLRSPLPPARNVFNNRLNLSKNDSFEPPTTTHSTYDNNTNTHTTTATKTTRPPGFSPPSSHPSSAAAGASSRKGLLDGSNNAATSQSTTSTTTATASTAALVGSGNGVAGSCYSMSNGNNSNPENWEVHTHGSSEVGPNYQQSSSERNGHVGFVEERRKKSLSGREKDVDPTMIALPLKSIDGLGHVEALMEADDLENSGQPPPWFKDKLSRVYNSLVVTNTREKAAEFSCVLQQHWIPWVCYYTVKARASKEPNYRQCYADFCDALGVSEQLIRITHTLIRTLFIYIDVAKDAIAYRQAVKNLGSWLGYITLAKDKPLFPENAGDTTRIVAPPDSRDARITPGDMLTSNAAASGDAAGANTSSNSSSSSNTRTSGVVCDV